MAQVQYQRFSKERRFADLVESVGHCSLCSRLHGRTRVLSDANGYLDSKVLFIAEAPGRLGADRTGVPLCGDQTGRNFEALLGNISWRRENVFLTNALLCNPRRDNGNNGTPSSAEIENCSAYLDMTIALVDPVVVITLGQVALKALARIVPHGLELKDSVACATPWQGRLLFPLYHPGPRARVHRALAKQRSDFMRLAKLVDPRKGLRKRRKVKKQKDAVDPAHPSVFQQLVLAITQALGGTTYFKLTKLLYFADLMALERLGHTLTGEIYLRQQEGPWPPTIKKVTEALDGYEIRRSFVRRTPMVAPGPSPRYSIQLDDEALEVLQDTLDKYGSMSNARIKTAAYRSAPMQYLLREERKGRDMRRVPVIYNNMAAPGTDIQQGS